MHSLPRDTLLETLLNALEAERYVRAPLLLNVLDELAACDALAPAAALAERLLRDLEVQRVGDAEFALRVAELRVAVRDLAALAAEPSGVSVGRLTESRAPRRADHRAVNVA